MKKFAYFLVISLIFTLFAFPVSAAEEKSRVIDTAGRLTPIQISSLQDRTEDLSDAHSFDVVIVFVHSLEVSTPHGYADNLFRNNYGYGSSHDGILLLVSMEERDWLIYRSGSGEDKFSDSMLDSIGGEVAELLSEGEYYEAALTFLDSTEEVLNGEYEASSDNSLLFAELIVIAVALILAFVIAGAVKRSMNTVRKQTGASGYIEGGIDLTVARDTYLYSTVTKVKIESNSSGSGGRRSSSRGGKF